MSAEDSSFADQAQVLRAQLDYHNFRYYVLDDAELTDDEYDVLFRQLEQLEAEHPELLSADSPTQKVGATADSPHWVPEDFIVENRNTVEHRRPMLSLSNATDRASFEEWLDRVFKGIQESTSKDEKSKLFLAVEYKMDGIAVELVYIDGTFTLGSTRGDGVRGEDITANLRTVRSIPKQIQGDCPALLELRGEAYLSNQAFAAMNAARSVEEGLFANPRNATAGTLKQQDPRVAASRDLDIVIYGHGEVRGLPGFTQQELGELLPKWGFPPPPHQSIVTTVDQVMAIYDETVAKRDQLPFEIDGLVIKVDNLKLREQLGERSRSPRWAVALKFPPRQATTILQDIEIQVGRTGALTPVAHLKPVSIGGVTVQRATLHNPREIERKGVKIGDTVVIQRAGDVIPEVVRAVESKRTGQERDFVLSPQCPACQSPIDYDEDDVVPYCQNTRCPEQVRGRLQHFASRQAMDIDGLGEKLVELLVEAELAQQPSDLYQLDRVQISQLDRMAEKSADNVLAAIEVSKQQPLARVIHALGIRNVGRTVASVLAEHFADLDKLMAAEADELVDIEEIGPIIAQNLHTFFRIPGNQQELAALKAAGLRWQEEKRTPLQAEAALDRVFSGKKFVITGTLNGLTRDEAKALIENHGGKVSGSISKKTDYLLAGERAGSKLEKAQKLEIAILDVAELQELIATAEGESS